MMMMSNSSLVNYTRISPNSNPRNKPISKITIHHVAGNLSIETIGAIFASTARQASSNYGIGTDGRIGMYVEEKNRAWTSSSAANDHQAVTIEVANDEIGGNWHVSDKALAALINLCVDICKRNGIEKLNFTGDASGNLTQHNYFAATACPGPYLKSKFPYIAEEVNKRLAPKPEPAPVPTPTFNSYIIKINNGNIYAEPNGASKVVGTTGVGSFTIVAEQNGFGKLKSGVGWVVLNTPAPVKREIKKGDIVNFSGGKHYTNSQGNTGYSVKACQARVTNIAKGAKHPYHIIRLNSKVSSVYGWVDADTVSLP
jgi:hypothetical protein